MVCALALALVLSPIHQGTDFSKKVTYSSPAAMPKVILADLSKLAGTSLTTSRVIDRELVVIKVKDVPLKEVLDRLAKAVSGDWKQEAGSYRLIRTTDTVRKLESEDFEQRVAAIKTSIAKQTARLQKQAAFDADAAKLLIEQYKAIAKGANPQRFDRKFWQRGQQLEAQSPGGRLMARVMSVLDPVEIASAPEGYRTVFSSNPTRMQRPLNAKIYPAIEQYLKEREIWVQANEDKPQEDDRQGMWFSGLTDIQKLKSKPAKALIIVTRYGSDSGANVELKIADEQGRSLVEQSGSLGSSWADGDQPVNPFTAPIDQKDPTIPISRASKEFIDSLSGMYGPGVNTQFRPPSDELKAILLNPDKIEPLSTLPSEVLLGIADLKGKNLVACLDDDFLLRPMTANSPQGIRLNRFLNTLGYDRSVSITDEGGWMIVKPGHPLNAGIKRIDRILLGQTVRLAFKQGRLSIEQLAQFALGCTGEYYDNLLSYFLTALMPEGRRMLDNMDFQWLRIYGTLNPNQRTALAAGQKLSIQGLDPATLGHINKVVFGQWPQLDVQPPHPEKMTQEDSELYYGNSLLREPTETLGNGIPGNATLSMTVEDGNVIFVSQRYGSGDDGEVSYGSYDQAMDDSAIAWQLFSHERKDLFPWQQQKIDHYQLGSRRKLDFTLEFMPQVTQHGSLQESQYKGDTFASLDKLPADMKKKIDDQMVKLREQYKDAKPGQNDYQQPKYVPPPAQ